MTTNTESAIDRATTVLKSGGVVAFPTDTLYALAADATDAAAVWRVFGIKGRDWTKPLPLFVTGLEMAETVGVFDETGRKLTQRFWPGALTLVVSVRPGFESKALVGGDTVALRAPGHMTALMVVHGLGKPVTATSANRSGGADPASADEVRSQIGDDVDYVLDGGKCVIGRGSTIVDCTGETPRILREGAIEASALRQVVPNLVDA